MDERYRQEDIERIVRASLEYRDDLTDREVDSEVSNVDKYFGEEGLEKVTKELGITPKELKVGEKIYLESRIEGLEEVLNKDNTKRHLKAIGRCFTLTTIGSSIGEVFANYALDSDFSIGTVLTIGPICGTILYFKLIKPELDKVNKKENDELKELKSQYFYLTGFRYE